MAALLSEDWAKQTKGDGSPLTIADQRANELICERLAQLAPHVPIVSTAWLDACARMGVCVALTR